MQIRQKTQKVVASVLALAGLGVFSLLGYAGSLEPAGPPGPTMKTLDEVEPRVPICASDLPLTITEPNSYYLVEDISFASTANHAITIECNDVTIDLMGYTLKGPDSGTKSGIYMNGCSNVEIRNGTLRDFGFYGIQGGGNGKGLRIVAMRVVSNGGDGISVWSCHNNLIKGCTVGENDQMGVTVGVGSTVAGNVVYGNDTGINTSFQCTITGNTVHDNDGTAPSRGIGIIAGYRSKSPKIRALLIVKTVFCLIKVTVWSSVTTVWPMDGALVMGPAFMQMMWVVMITGSRETTLPTTTVVSTWTAPATSLSRTRPRAMPATITT
jgi:hypothetical protein